MNMKYVTEIAGADFVSIQQEFGDKESLVWIREKTTSKTLAIPISRFSIHAVRAAIATVISIIAVKELIGG